MSGFVPIPWGSGFLLFSRAEFDAALARGLAPAPGASARDAGPTVAPQGLLDSAQLGEALSLTAQYCEEMARQKRWPSHRVGRYVRFDLSEVRAAIAANGAGK